MPRRHDRALGRPVQRNDRIAWRADQARKRPGPGGSWDVPGVACRTGVQIYEDERGTVRELRPHREVMDPESLASLVGVALTLQHPGQGRDDDRGLQEVTIANYRDLTHGSVLSVAPDAPEPGLVEAWSRLQSQEILDAAQQGTRELSCGYEAVLLDPFDPANADYVAELGPEPGVTHEGERYDLIQTAIRYNHLAVVDQARAGPVARLRLDRKGKMHEDYVEKRGPEWVVLSKEGKVLEKGFTSEKAANERLRQIEAAKHAKGDAYANEHAARQKDPGGFERFRRTHPEGIPEGIDLIIGFRKGGGSEVQAVRASAEKFSTSEFRSWLESHDFNTTIEEASGDSAERYDSHTAQGAAMMTKITIKRCDGQTTDHEIPASGRWIVDALAAHKPAEELRADADGVMSVTIEGMPEMVLPEEMVKQMLAAVGMGGTGPSQPETMPAEPAMPMDADMPMSEEEKMAMKMDAKALAEIDRRIRMALDAALPRATKQIADSVTATTRERAALDRAALPVLGQRFDYASVDAHGLAVAVLRADQSPKLAQAEALALRARKGDAKAAGRLEQLMEDVLDRRRDEQDSSGQLGAMMFELAAQARSDAGEDERPSWEQKRDSKRQLATGRKPTETTAA